MNDRCQLEDILVEIEEHLDRHRPRAAANGARRCVERLLKDEVRRMITSGKPAEREAMLDRLPTDRPLERLMLGQLYRALERHKLFLDKRRERALRRFATITNTASHDSSEIFDFQQAYLATDILWEVLEQLGVAEPSLRDACRKRARLHSVRMAARAGADPRARLDCARLPTPLVLDRKQQRECIQQALNPPPDGVAVAVYGGADQGHEAMSDFCLEMLRQVRPGLWANPGTIAWPHHLFSPAHRWGELTEGLAHSLNPHGLGTSKPEALVAAIDKHCSRTGRHLFVRHRVSSPDSADVDLLERYLNEIWSPAAVHNPDITLALNFEFVIPDAKGWWFSSSVRMAARAAKAAERTIRALERWADGAPCSALILPELRSLTVAEIEHYLPQHIREQLEPGVPRKLAREVFVAARNGRFEKVVEQLRTCTWSTR